MEKIVILCPSVLEFNSIHLIKWQQTAFSPPSIANLSQFLSEFQITTKQDKNLGLGLVHNKHGSPNNLPFPK